MIDNNGEGNQDDLYFELEPSLWGVTDSLVKFLGYTFFAPTMHRIHKQGDPRVIARSKKKLSGKIGSIAGYAIGSVFPIILAHRVANGNYEGLEVIAASQVLSLGYEGLRKCRKYFSRKSNDTLDELNRDVNSYEERQ